MQPSSFCPYKGLLPYDEEDREYFFGREEESETVAANLLTAPLTILYGTSGVGKTSILQAGVIPFLQGVHKVKVVIYRKWQDQRFLHALKAKISAAAPALLLDSSVYANMPLDELLARVARATGSALAVILDQFEEYFLYHPNGSGAAFDAELARAVNRRDSEASFLLSLREDRLSGLDRFQTRIPTLFENYLRIEHLSREAARAAIEKPIEHFNLRPDSKSKEMTVEPRLVEAILKEVVAGKNPWLDRPDDQSKEIPKPATERIEAPFLQLVLYRLWDEEIGSGSRILHEKTLTQLGGAKEIVRDHLKSALAALSPAEQETAANVFHYLVTSSGTKIAHTAKDLADYARISEAELKPLLDKLSDPEKRILRPVSTRTDLYEITRYEIFHDVLGPAIVEWGKDHLRVKEAAEASKKAAEEAREASRRRELEQAQELALEQQRRFRDKAKAARRLKLMNVGLMAACLLIALAAGAAIWQWSLAKSSEKAAQEALAEAEKSKSKAQMAEAAAIKKLDDVIERTRKEMEKAAEQESQRLVTEAMSIEQTQPRQSFTLVIKALAKAPTQEAQQALAKLLQEAPVMQKWQADKEMLRDVVFSPDGSRIATGGADAAVKMWDLGAKRPEAPWRVFSGTGAVQGLSFGHQTNPATKVGSKGTFDSKTGYFVAALTNAATLDHHPTEVAAGFVEDVRRDVAPDYLAAALTKGGVIVWRIDTGNVYRKLGTDDAPALGVSFSKTGNHLAAACSDGTVRVWALNAVAPPTILKDHGGRQVNCLAFSRDTEKYLVSGGQDGTAILWDVQGSKSHRILKGHTGAVHGVSFSSDGSKLATASADKTVKVWDTKTGKVIFALTGHQDEVYGVEFSSDPTSSYIGTASKDKTVRIWDAEKGQLLVNMPAYPAAAYSVRFSPFGSRLATACADGYVRVYNFSLHDLDLLRPSGSGDWPVNVSEWLTNPSKSATNPSKLPTLP